MNYFTVFQTLPWPARSPDPSPIEHVWDMMRRQLHLPGNVDDLAQQEEQIWQEIPQETIRVLYHTMSRCVAACIQAREKCSSSPEDEQKQEEQGQVKKDFTPCTKVIPRK
ncbi:transposable element Tcb1 transposase [Trichonephila clavipes]|nr:transposable element Tcb1 transposase [Trichonephila clavipes]